MKILVVGGGGREHAIIRKLKESKQVDALYCAPGNGGISKDAECFPVKATDVEGMVALAKQLAVDLVFVAPDDPLVLGMVDAMQAAGFATFGPNQAAAIIEGSKAFSKELMKKYHIPQSMKFSTMQMQPLHTSSRKISSRPSSKQMVWLWEKALSLQPIWKKQNRLSRA